MNKIILKKIIENRKLFVPNIFTRRQLDTIETYLLRKKLNQSQKHSLYTAIKRKVAALEAVYVEDRGLHIYGADKILPGRLGHAKEVILRLAPGRIFVGGSFLFSNYYNDIDVFIVRQRGYKEYHDQNLHIIELSEKMFRGPVFQSAARISVANFPINFKIEENAIKLHEMMSLYHEALIEIIGARKREAGRNLVFQYYQIVRVCLLDGFRLRQEVKSLTKNSLNSMFREILLKLYSNDYLYVVLHEYVKSLESAIVSEKNISHLLLYKEFYEEVIHEARARKAAAV